MLLGITEMEIKTSLIRQRQGNRLAVAFERRGDGYNDNMATMLRRRIIKSRRGR